MAEIKISPEVGTQRKDYHGTYSLYEDELIDGAIWKVIQLECRWRDESSQGMSPSDKVFEGHLSYDGGALVIHHNKRGDIRLSA